MNGLAPSELEEWYDAIRLWNKFLTSADSEYWVQLSPGTAVGKSHPHFLVYKCLFVDVL